MEFNRIGVVGGTGALGGGIAVRLARAEFAVAIGSRNPEKAVAAAEEIARASGSTAVTGHDNYAAAETSDLVIVAVPFANQIETLRAIAPAVQGKIVVDTTVPLVPPKVARVQLPEAGSAAMMAAEALGPGVRVVSAFHNVSAAKMWSPESVECDVLVFGDDVEARGAVVEGIAAMGLRGLHGGPLVNSVAAEAMTSVLISINRRYRIEEGAGIRITGI